MGSTTENNRLRQADGLLLVESMFYEEFRWVVESDPQQGDRDPEFEITLPNFPYTLHFTLPYNYPDKARPIVFLDCGSSVPNTTRKRLRTRLDEALVSLPEGQESIDILLANFTEILKLESTLNTEKDENEVPGEDRSATVGTPTIKRAVLWFHHLLSTQKRHQIVNWSRSLNLAGYSRPGYPGALVIEGEKAAVDDYITQLKGLKWQAIQVRDEEEVVLGERILPRNTGVIELGSLGDIAENLKKKGGDRLEGWFLAAMKIK